MNGWGAVLWLILAVGLFVIETATYQMVCIWFSVGSLLAMVIALLGFPLWVQLVVFLIASVAVLIVGRPIVKEMLWVKRQATNADRVIGQAGVVKEPVDNEQQTGRVTVAGLDWAARTVQEGLVLPVDSKVKILRIEGVKLIVEPLESIKQTEGV